MIAGPGPSDLRRPDAPRHQLVRRTIAAAAILGIVTAAGALATSLPAQSLPQIHTAGEPSTGTDGRRHLVYELGDPSREGVVVTYRRDAAKTIYRHRCAFVEKHVRSIRFDAAPRTIGMLWS